jgi:type VI secretion system protein ImpF
MPRANNEIRIAPSILDQLIDEDPKVSREPPPAQIKSLESLKQSVRRDLEWLLNTRQSIHRIPEDFEEVSRSIAAYGLPDFTAVSVKSAAEQDRIRRALLSAIRLFEPRLEDVTISLDLTQERNCMLRFRIAAVLHVEPVSEPVTFDTLLDLQTGQYDIQGQR